MHAAHIVDVQSIINRVWLDDKPMKNWQAAQRIIDKMHHHCHRFFSDLTDETQFIVNETGNLKSKILKSALSALNGFYQEEKLATGEQFKAAINESIMGVTKWELPPLFEEVTDEKEVAHV